MDKDELDKLLIKVLQGEITSTHQIPCDDFISCRDWPFCRRTNPWKLACSCLDKEQMLEMAVEYLEKKFKKQLTSFSTYVIINMWKGDT